MTGLEALEKAREKIAAELVHEPYGRDIAFRNNGLRRAMSIIDEAISAERDRLADAGETKPEPGDVVAWPNPPHGHVMIGLYGRDWTSDIGLVVLMRAAEVRARIEGEK